MIPLRDTVPSRTIPVVNYIIIGLCGIVFLFELSLGPQLEGLVRSFAVVPVHVTTVLSGEVFSPGPIASLFTSMFLHGGWIHLLGNMLYLYIFGDNVEDRLGHIPYLVFYLLSGAAAALTEVYVRPASAVPIIGASGAIAGVLGAYFILYPRARVLTLIPLFVFFPVVEISAFFFLGFWFIMQFLEGSMSVGTDVQGGVAWWAHAGGFVVGIVLLPLFLLTKRLSR